MHGAILPASSRGLCTTSALPLCAPTGMTGFKPVITSRRAASLSQADAAEILDSWSDLRRRRWRPAKTPGALRFVSLALHILSHKGERRRRNVSARKSPNHRSIRRRVSQKLTCKSPAHTAPQKTHKIQQAWMNSRNPFNITILENIVNSPSCIPRYWHDESSCCR